VGSFGASWAWLRSARGFLAGFRILSTRNRTKDNCWVRSAPATGAVNDGESFACSLDLLPSSGRGPALGSFGALSWGDRKSGLIPRPDSEEGSELGSFGAEGFATGRSARWVRLVGWSTFRPIPAHCWIDGTRWSETSQLSKIMDIIVGRSRLVLRIVSKGKRACRF
jgi:hypothetical protein